MKRFRDLWDQLSSTPMRIPVRVDIDPDHTLNYKQNSAPFVADEHYFQVYINEMYLTDQREWFRVFDPMVFVVSEFIYDKKVETVPSVIGPSMLKQFGKKLPKGMIFSDTRTIGPTPFRGGNFVLAVILYKSTRKDYLKEILTLIENVCNVVPITSMITTYLKTAKVLMAGFESLLDMGDIVPLVGHRREFGGAAISFTPGYYVIIDLPESERNAYELWVKDRQLFYGSDPENLKAFREADYILYSITQSNERDDISTLPFYTLYEGAKEEAGKAKDVNWENAKINLINLNTSLMLSPDLTPRCADSLTHKYQQDAKTMHERALDIATMGHQEEKEEPLVTKKIRQESLNILKM
jgi:hypothetical protein